jgi:hypothetical protein
MVVDNDKSCMVVDNNNNSAVDAAMYHVSNILKAVINNPSVSIDTVIR